MKATAVLSALALAGFAVAAPTVKVAAEKSGFGIVAGAECSKAIDSQSINANGGYLWIGKNTRSSCPFEKYECPAGDKTAFLHGNGSLSMYVELSGGQQVYIAPGGALRYTVAHAAVMPQGSITGGFREVTQLDLPYDLLTHKGEFMACLVRRSGPYKIYIAANGFSEKNCVPLQAQIRNSDQLSAWEYT